MIFMRYYKIIRINSKEFNLLDDIFTSKDAQKVGLPISVLRKMRFRGIVERIQYKSNEFIWRKQYNYG